MQLVSNNDKPLTLEGGAHELEKQDKQRVQSVRTQFYQLNEKFEQFLKFKPIRKL